MKFLEILVQLVGIGAISFNTAEAINASAHGQVGLGAWCVACALVVARSWSFET